MLLLPALTIASAGAAAEEEEDPAPSTGGDVAIEVEEAVLVLGKDTEAVVSFELPKGTREVALFAQHGRVDRIAMAEDGRRVEARYTPPTQFIPRVDVIAARVETGDGVSWGYATTHLIGQGMAEIKTSPKALATIDIGDRSFGPVRADRKGKAKIRVQVPPGISEGTDGEGRKVDLHLPAGLPGVRLRRQATHHRGG